MDFLTETALLRDRRASGKAILGGSAPDDTAPCTHDDRVQGRVHGNTRDEKAHSVVYGRISAFIKAARGGEYGGELRTA